MKMPVVLNMTGPVIIFGGGNIGQRKVEYASKFTDDITVISKEALPMPDHVRIKLAEVDDTNISEHIPDNTALVISALPDRELNKAIAKEWGFPLLRLDLAAAFGDAARSPEITISDRGDVEVFSYEITPAFPGGQFQWDF